MEIGWAPKMLSFIELARYKVFGHFFFSGLISHYGV